MAVPARHHGDASMTTTTAEQNNRRPAESLLVSDAGAMLNTVKRLHFINDGIIFWNEQRTFKLMLRNDPVDADTVSCELALVFEDDDEVMQRVLDLTNDGYMDEPGVFILDSWTHQLADFCADDARKIMNAVNDAYLYKTCPCGNYLVKDDAAHCLFCQMTRAPGQETHFCTICCEDGLAMHMTRQPCCQQRLHAHCLATWRTKSGDDRCPLCRA